MLENEDLENEGEENEDENEDNSGDEGNAGNAPDPLKSKKAKIVKKAIKKGIPKKKAENIINYEDDPEPDDESDVKAWLKRVEDKLDKLLTPSDEDEDEDSDEDEDDEPVKRKKKKRKKVEATPSEPVKKRSFIYWE